MSQIIPQQKEIQSQFPDSNNLNHREIAATLVCKGEPKASQQRGAFLFQRLFCLYLPWAILYSAQTILIDKFWRDIHINY
jgi:hypothetical protein